MKSIITTALLCLSSFLFAQTNEQPLGQIEYAYKVAFQKENETDSIRYSIINDKLTFSKTAAMYTRIFDHQKKSVRYTNKEDSALVANNKKLKDYVDAEIAKVAQPNLNVNGEVIFLKKHNSSILIRQHSKPGLEKYLITDTLPQIDWQIFEDKKILLGYTCQKAIGKFRGRIYTAWFTLEIPVATGPWKLSGLPGIILAANDDKNEILFETRKIEIPAVKPIIIPEKLGGIEITNDKFLEISNANFKKIQEKNESMIRASGGTYVNKFAGRTVLMELTKN